MISIVIPVLNEAENIADLLVHITQVSNPTNITKIIVVDGGSLDDTVEEVERFKRTHSNSNPCVELLLTEKGRAHQMNQGARLVKGGILYFLHADSFPPRGFDDLIVSEVKKGNNAGCFQMRFDSNHWWLRLAGWLTRFKWRACRGGDQSQFITKTLFEDIGGFDERYTIYEDNILINELYKRNEFVVIRNPLTTSSRLYEKKGVWRLQYHFWAIYIKKMFGANPEELYQYYKDHIAS